MNHNGYTPPVGDNSYLNNWSNHNTQHTANKIDHIADKAAFAIEMLQNALIGFDALEKELIETSNAPHPPQSQTLRSYAHRIDTNQKQLQDGLNKIKQLMSEIDNTTNQIQNPRGTW